MREVVKDPDATVDYLFDWRAFYLADAETITSASAVVTPTGLTIDSDPNTANDHTIWVSGGTRGETYLLTSRVVTSDGRTDDHSIHVIVRDK